MSAIVIAVFHFFGSIFFALLLISLSAFYAIVGTLLESATSSHRFASLYTYNDTFFIALLWGYFVNILFSALRRYPFQRRHIPFLITHWGLLMILTGALLKSSYGIQGNILVTEGSSSSEVIFPESYALQIEKRDSHRGGGIVRRSIPVDPHIKRYSPFDDLRLDLSQWHPHHTAQFELLAGVGYGEERVPFYFAGFDSSEKNSAIIKGIEWSVIADSCDSDPWFLVREKYVAAALCIISDARTAETIWEGPLQHLLNEGVTVERGALSGELKFHPERAELWVECSAGNCSRVVVTPIHGAKALINIASEISTGSLPFTVDLKVEPTIILLQGIGELSSFAFTPYGQIGVEVQRPFQALLSYGEGFGGYGLQVNIPIYDLEKSRVEKKSRYLDLLSLPLKREESNDRELAIPLQLFKHACESIELDFPPQLVAFLAQWQSVDSWLYDERSPLVEDLSALFSAIDWGQVPQSLYHGALWNCLFFDQLEPLLREGRAVWPLLEERGWPLLAELQKEGISAQSRDKEVLDAISAQIFSAADRLGAVPLPFSNTAERNARLFTALMRAWRFHLSDLELETPVVSGEELTQKIQLELPLSLRCEVATPSSKLEENSPYIVLKASEGDKNQCLHLSYDKLAEGLKWPLLGGKYRLRFQPMVQSIPYRLRLRQARQINYVDSLQPYSYECDLLISEINNGVEVETTISMNNVYETWDGYRFYLANISPNDPGALKYVQIIVNRDPGKYWLTYPGAVIMSIGVVLLFWGRGQRNSGGDNGSEE